MCEQLCSYVASQSWVQSVFPFPQIRDALEYILREKLFILAHSFQCLNQIKQNHSHRGGQEAGRMSMFVGFLQRQKVGSVWPLNLQSG